jgi:predicted dehydrogenase
MTEQDQLRVAVVGAGYFAQFHYDAWARIPEVRLAALIEPDTEKARATAARFQVPATHASLDELFEAGAPDVLDIVTPPLTHRPLVETACTKVSALVCQKPLAPSLEEAVEIVALARAAGCPLIVHENFRPAAP